MKRTNETPHPTLDEQIIEDDYHERILREVELRAEARRLKRDQEWLSMTMLGRMG